jgi:DNA-binding transcriptional LysR family regulator
MEVGMDRLQAMRVFSKVVEHGGFARAAVALGLSNTVVTRNVAELESHLGTRLLNRTTRKLALTEAGQQYLERVRQILADIDEAEALATTAARTASGTLRIYCQPSFGQAQLAPLLPKYAAQMPDVCLDVTLADKAVDLVEDAYDVGIFNGLQKIEASMVARQLATSRVVLCASREYLERHGEPREPADISQHKCLNFAYEQLRHSWYVHSPQLDLEVPISSCVVSNSGVVLRHACLAGMGIMIRSSFTLGDDLSSGRLVQVLKGHNLGCLPVMLVYPSRRLLSYKVRSFIDFMTAQFPDPDGDPWLTDN